MNGMYEVRFPSKECQSPHINPFLLQFFLVNPQSLSRNL